MTAIEMKATPGTEREQTRGRGDRNVSPPRGAIGRRHNVDDERDNGAVYDGLENNMANKITAAHINRELKKRGISERLVQGRGYIYFTDGDSSSWESSSIAVCYVADIVQPTLTATVDRVLSERNELRGFSPRRTVHSLLGRGYGRIDRMDGTDAAYVHWRDGSEQLCLLTDLETLR